MEAIQERARELGRLLSQTEEYKALQRANDQLSGDREAVGLLNRLLDLQEELAGALQSGREPTQAQQEEYESIAEQLERRSQYQAMVAAQSNFDRLMVRINQEIAKGIDAGAQSRIILSS